MIRTSLLVGCLLLLTACPASDTTNNATTQTGSGSNSSSSENGAGTNPTPAPTQTNDSSKDGYAPPVFNGTTKKTRKVNNIESPAVLADVRTGKHNGFDRVVFEFKGSEMPGYYIEYIGEPITQCGSGNKVELTGNGGLEIRFAPAQAHTEEGKPTLFFSDNEQNPGYDIIKKVKSTCDFEGNVTWVVGVSKANNYRVLELENPVRLAVDIEHKEAG
ncbi:MAG: hypothetical protein HKN33_05850 [Pyrinomonadaceae bacterium]|nr:hypothetical protein [Pyrinomonadaceae bacterium]